jgi:hypothetical protein
VSPVALAALVVGVLAVIGVYLSWTAGRIDRLHRRVEAARSALDAQLVRRAAAADALAQSGCLPAVVAERLGLAAGAARHADGVDRFREEVENALSRALHGLPATLAGGCDLTELAASCRKVGLARRFYNDAVRDTLVLRSRRVVRLLHLYGRASPPGYFDIDDTPMPEVRTVAPVTHRAV